MEPARPARDPGRVPEHEATYRRLRDMVMFGELVPGQKVTIQGVAAALDAGMTPVREAIRRLTAEGALVLHENRRISVPLLTMAQLDELAFARLALEPRLAELALARLAPAQVDAIEAIDAGIDRAMAGGDIPGYLAGNHAFHFALYEAAGAPILTALTRSLWLRFGPSLRVVMTSGDAIGRDLHKEAVAALRRGDAAALLAAVAEDIAQGIDRVRADLRDEPDACV